MEANMKKAWENMKYQIILDLEVSYNRMTMSLQDKLYMISSNGIPAVLFFLNNCLLFEQTFKYFERILHGQRSFPTANLISSEEKIG